MFTSEASRGHRPQVKERQSCGFGKQVRQGPEGRAGPLLEGSILEWNSVLPLQGTWVRALVGELRSHKLRQNQKIKIKRETFLTMRWVAGLEGGEKLTIPRSI